MLKKLGIQIEDDVYFDDYGHEITYIYFKKNDEILHVRKKEEVINENELKKVNNVLYSAVKDKDFTQCFYALVDGADVNYKNDNGYPILAYCTITGDDSYQILDLLVDNGLDINVVCEYGALLDNSDWDMHSPLSQAVANGNLQMVKLLLENGADACASPHGGETPLHAIVMNVNKETYLNKRKILALLLQYGADIDAKNDMGLNSHEYCLLTQRGNENSQYYWGLIRFFADYRMRRSHYYFCSE